MSARTGPKEPRKPKNLVEQTWDDEQASLYECERCKIRFIAMNPAASRLATGYNVTCGRCGEYAHWLRYVEKGETVEVTKE